MWQGGGGLGAVVCHVPYCTVRPGVHAAVNHMPQVVHFNLWQVLVRLSDASQLKNKASHMMHRVRASAVQHRLPARTICVGWRQEHTPNMVLPRMAPSRACVHSAQRKWDQFGQISPLYLALATLLPYIPCMYVPPQ